MEREVRVSNESVRQFHLEGGIIGGIIGFVKKVIAMTSVLEKHTMGKAVSRMTK